MTIGNSSLLFEGAIAAAGLALVLAAWKDLRSFTIPNRFCVVVGAAYLPALLELSPAMWAGGLVVGILVLLVGSVLFARRWVGGGDVKLASATALWAGPAFMDQFMLVMSAAGAILATAIVATPLPRLLGSTGTTVAGFNQPMPFGVPIAVGGLWVLALHFTSI